MKIRGGKGNETYMSICKYCNTPFLSNRSTAMYCSDSHRVKYARKKARIKLHDKILNEIKTKYSIYGIK
jgi:hypothetical protein